MLRWIRAGRPRWCAGLALAAVAALAAGVGALAVTGGTVKIKPSPSGFDTTGKLSRGGRVVSVGGPFACSTGGRTRIHVTVTQRKSGAFALGTWTGTCTGREQDWLARKVRARGAADFQPGQSEACAAAVARNVRRATDATQWCGAVLLRR
jgi:hypothetical protein